MKRTISHANFLTLCCCLSLFLAACGQRGPLYLPEENDPPAATEVENLEEEQAQENEEDADEETPRA